ncbi:hypothetical protein ACXYTJ_03975 [Gilvimarinus sp. F26214L]|uniref:hypothetical protein n=1 Tax=Gilvimarinus sp. DZF01 TaxID=3461371 RepID=UPI004045DC72
MKIFAASIFWVVSVCAAYWYGVQIGGSRVGLQFAASDALDSKHTIEILKHATPQDAIDWHESEINQSLVAYGRYLDDPNRFAPGLARTDDATRSLFELVALYRTENPRSIDAGVFEFSGDENRLTEEDMLQIKEAYDAENSSNIYYFNKAMEQLAD